MGMWCFHLKRHQFAKKKKKSFIQEFVFCNPIVIFLLNIIYSLDRAKEFKGKLVNFNK